MYHECYNDRKLDDIRNGRYNITKELDVKRILMEKLNDPSIELVKMNADKTGYDFKIYKTFIDGNDYNRKFIGYLEVEVSESWNTFKYPPNFKWHSFLARKVFVYDIKNETFRDKKLKENANRTIYLKTNSNMSNAICCDMITISKFYMKYDPSPITSSNPRNDTFLREYVGNENSKTIMGWENCTDFIKDFIKRCCLTLK